MLAGYHVYFVAICSQFGTEISPYRPTRNIVSYIVSYCILWYSNDVM